MTNEPPFKPLSPAEQEAFRREVMEYFAGQEVFVFGVNPETGELSAHTEPAEIALADMEND